MSDECQRCPKCGAELRLSFGASALASIHVDGPGCLRRQLAQAEGREGRLREACGDMVDALRFIRDHDNRGLIAQHGDALEAGLAALRLAASEEGADE